MNGVTVSTTGDALTVRITNQEECNQQDIRAVAENHGCDFDRVRGQPLKYRLTE